MTTLKRVLLNGTAFYPTSIDEEDVRIADGPTRMVDGTLRMWHRAFKKKWKLTWNSIPEQAVPGIRTIYHLTSSFVYNDVDNVGYSVVATTKNETLSAEQLSLAGIFYYNIEMTLEEV